MPSDTRLNAVLLLAPPTLLRPRAPAPRHRAVLLAGAFTAALMGGSAMAAALLLPPAPAVPPPVSAVSVAIADPVDPSTTWAGEEAETAIATNDTVADEETTAAAEDADAPVVADLPPVSVPDTVRLAIAGATRVVGVDAGYLTAVAARESSFRTSIRASNTTAVGLYQFTAETWLRVVKVFGARHGLAAYAKRIEISDDGDVYMPYGRARTHLMQLRSDPHLSALMAAELARDNKLRLEHVLGRDVTPSELYIAHLLGVTQAARLIAAAHSAPYRAGADLMPEAAVRNPGLFSPAGKPVSAGAIVGEIEAFFDREVPRYSRT
jgi:hypothetical protein